MSDAPLSDELVPALRQVQAYLAQVWAHPRIRLLALLVVGAISWWLILRNYPLQRAVPRYAEF